MCDTVEKIRLQFTGYITINFGKTLSYTNHWVVYQRLLESISHRHLNIRFPRILIHCTHTVQNKFVVSTKYMTRDIHSTVTKLLKYLAHKKLFHYNFREYAHCFAKIHTCDIANPIPIFPNTCENALIDFSVVIK